MRASKFGLQVVKELGERERELNGYRQREQEYVPLES